MAIRVALHHQTTYDYDRPVTLGPQIVRLRPAPHTRTPILSYSLKIEPAEHFINWQQDPQSNYLARLVFPKKVRQFHVTVDLIAEMVVINPFDFFLEEYAEAWPFAYDASLAEELAPFRKLAPLGPRLNNWLAGIDRSPKRTADKLVELNQRLNGEIKYLIRLEPGVQAAEETLEKQCGSCRDTSWLFVEALRHLGFAARFVSGYLIQLKPDEKPIEGPAGAAQDFTDLHAWAEVYLPGAGWVGLDPTSGLFAGEGHIPLAATPEPQSAAPISGMVEDARTEFGFEMSVTRVQEEPRVTWPYSDEAWERVNELGRAVDRDLVAQDVRLTMGGEPTFVSIDDMEGAEWNTAAMGPNKRRLSETLLKKLRDRFTTGALLHYGQGKWYPGETLPRWALACYWRKDGKPIWRDPSLLADDASNHGHTIEDADRFMRLLARKLAVDPDYTRLAFEDPVHFLHKEGKLPVNVDPINNKLEDAEDRTRLRRVFERGLNTPVGVVLPIRAVRDLSGEMVWQSGLWLLQSKHVVLVPGDSPVGYRLPLPSLPWVAPSDYPHVIPADPMAPREELAVPIPQRRIVSPEAERGVDQGFNEQTLPDETPEQDRAPAPGESAKWVVRTALSIEPRHGKLHMFMPPLRTIEEYLSLIASIEDTAAELRAPVVIEGYSPPHDHRIESFKVTPDPGVIEVNTPPTSSWDDLVHLTTSIYEDAKQSRLGTDKFNLDGRHTGTGGGNHVIVGGSTPADSPLLRRPDLLRSLIAYWLNHPSLSYLFSGTFIGPTSQAPRVDEGRQDAVYELEIAFQELERQLAKGSPPPWLVDRVFGDLLVDVTGNKHRAEFCIDKLYAPGAASGRLGLLELRALEMPPHARMSLVQQLLIRALIAWMWREPYRARPTRWGTQLHDRFLLPHYVDEDFREVLADLGRAGYAFERDWFKTHFEFRFPVHGRAQYGGIVIELRQAIEPWYVLGEEGAIGGTVRYVDSSVERMQAKVTGLTGDRYVLTVGGRRVPLQPTATHGEFVAGVRYRAWQPPSCLHPTIGVHTPLVFDLLDTWSGRSLGGCTYHVAHPGGRNYATFPVNANEAEARRYARFFPFGHTPGRMATPPEEPNPQFPCTLDLRRRSMAH